MAGESGQMNFLDSHDIPRFLSYCNGNRKRMELAFFYLFMGVGVPSVFYGDEVYIEGMKELEYRAAMDWQAVMEQQAENNRLHILPSYHCSKLSGNCPCVMPHALFGVQSSS